MLVKARVKEGDMKDDVETTRLTMTVDCASKALGISRCLAYEMARQGKIPTIRLGRRLLISRKGLDELLSAKAAQAQCQQQEAIQG